MPWWNNGLNSMLPLLRAQPQPLLGELRSHKPPAAADQSMNRQTSTYLRGIPWWSSGREVKTSRFYCRKCGFHLRSES